MLFLNQSFAQTGTTRGKEFYISILENSATTEAHKVKMFLSTFNQASVGLEVGTGFNQNLFLTPNSWVIVDIPDAYFHTAPEIKEQIGIYIGSDEEISAFVVNQATATTDGSMPLPVASMEDYYMINSYNVLPPLTRVTPQQLSLLATEDSTIVDIIFTAPTDIDTGWDGTYEGEPAPVGFYT